MGKGQNTREFIVRRAASLFNSKGYYGTSMSDLMTSTGLKKGGIYNHFESKEEILVAALEYALNRLYQELINSHKHERTMLGKLQAIIEFYRNYPLEPVIDGGCVLLNASVEAEHNQGLLKEKVKEAFNYMLKSTQRMVSKGIERGEFREDVDPNEVAVLFFTMIEGGIVMVRSSEDRSHMDIVCNQLHKYVESLCVT